MNLPVVSLIALAGAGLALALEMSGAPPGGKKRVARWPQAVLVAVTGALIALVPALLPAASGAAGGGVVVAVALIAFAGSEGAGLVGERAALALLLAAGTLAAAAAPAPAASLAYLALFAAVNAGLAMGAEAGSEAAAKSALLGLMGVVLAGVGRFDPSTALAGTVAVLWTLGLTPLQGMRVDAAQGAPPSAVGLTTPLALVALVPGLSSLRGVAGLDVLLGLALFGLPLVALAQTSLRRLVAVLVVSQSTLPLVALRAGVDVADAVVAGGIGAVALAVSVQALPPLVAPRATWEDASGLGRRAPWRAGLFVLAGAIACGLPPTLGFLARETLAARLGADAPWLAAGLFVNAGLQALPVVRLALFLFAKEPRPSTSTATPWGAVAAVVVVVAVAGVYALVPWLKHL